MKSKDYLLVDLINEFSNIFKKYFRFNNIRVIIKKLLVENY